MDNQPIQSPRLASFFTPPKLIGTLLLILSIFLVYKYIDTPMVITVTGSGSVSMPSLRARYQVTLVATHESANQALTDLRNKINTVKSTMVMYNTEASSISESQIQLTPLASIVSGGRGYSASLTMTAITMDLASTPDMLVQLYQNGASLVSQPVVLVENHQEFENEALDKALKAASNQASVLQFKHLKPFRKIIAIETASSGEVAASSKQDLTSDVVSTSSEIIKAVSVSYALW